MARGDYDDRPVRGTGELAGMEKFLANTPVAIILALVSFFCCPCIGIVLGLVGVFTVQHPDAKRNSMIMLAAGILSVAIGVILQATGVYNFQAQLGQ